MKRILILTVTAGSAHNACAKGMQREIEKRGDAEVKVVDLLKSFSTKRNAWIADAGYGLAVSRFTHLYNAFYRRYRSAKPYKRYTCAPQKTVLSALTGLLQKILSFKPDVIYCTHFYAAIAITDLKLVYPLPCKVFAATIDYVNSPFWEAGIGVDFLILPNEDFVGTYRALGYRENQLLPLGIPVDGRTVQKADKRTARQELGLVEGVFTVTVMFGGGHWKGGYKIFKQLLSCLEGRKAQIIMINGKDEKSFHRVEKRKRKSEIKILNAGYVEDITKYLSASDVVINKCGGGSSTEALNLSVCMLITEKLAAQEAYNLSYLKRKGAALSFKNKKELKAQLLRLMDDSEFLRRMAENTLPLRKNATGELAETILSQPNASYDGYYDLLLIRGIDLRARLHVRKALKKADKDERERAKRNKF